jgi:hypothetical protein
MDIQQNVQIGASQPFPGRRVTWADLEAAERDLDDAESELEESRSPSSWIGFETLDKSGRKGIEVMPGSIERQQHLSYRRDAARLYLQSLRRAWLEAR